MLPTLIAAAMAGALASWMRARAWRVPFGLLSIATVLRGFIGAFVTVLVLGSVALVVLRASSVNDAQLAAAVFGGAVGLGLTWTSTRRMRDVRGLTVLCQRIGEDEAEEQALAALERLLDEVRAADSQRYIALVLMATGPLTHAGKWEAARARLRSLRELPLTTAQSVLCNQALATCELQFDDLEAAEDAIGRIERPTEPSIEVWLIAIEALLMAVRGDSERALAHLGGQDASDNASLRASHRLVHAHIYAARGDLPAATTELERLRDEAGRPGLERVVRPRGPATELAERMLGAEDQNHEGAA